MRALPTVRWPASVTLTVRRVTAQQSEQQSGEDRDAEREGEHRAIDGDLVGARREARREPDEQVANQIPAAEAERTSGDRQHRALGQQLASDAAASCPEGGAHSHLALPSQYPRERQVRDVGSHQQQYKSCGREQDEQRRPGVARQLVAHRRRGRLEAGVGGVVVRILVVQAIRDDGEVVLDAIEGGVRLEAADSRQHPSLSIRDRLGIGSERTGGRWHVDVVLGGKLRNRRQDANYGVHAVVHLERATDDAGISAERVLPERMTDHQHRRRIGRIVVRSEHTTQHRLDAEHVEELGRDHAGLHARGFATTEQIERHLVVLDDGVERRRLRPVVLDLLDRHTGVGDADSRRLLAHLDEPIAVRVWQRPQQHGMHHAEDRRVRADAEGECEQNDRRVAGILRERACGVAPVLPDRIDRPETP
jgi:hypothetical protein